MIASRGYKWVVRVSENNNDNFCLGYERTSADKLDRDPDVLSYDVDPYNAVRAAINELHKGIDKINKTIKALTIQSMACMLVGKNGKR